MSIAQILALTGIGVGVGALTYYSYFRKHYSRVDERQDIESMMSVPIPAVSEPASEKLKIGRPAAKEKPSTPIKAICGFCEKVATLPFRCKFCVALFCGDHRLPENHDCEAL